MTTLTNRLRQWYWIILLITFLSLIWIELFALPLLLFSLLIYRKENKLWINKLILMIAAVALLLIQNGTEYTIADKIMVTLILLAVLSYMKYRNNKAIRVETYRDE